MITKSGSRRLSTAAAQAAGVRLQAHEALVGVVAAAARHVLVLEVEAGGADVLHLVDQALHGEDRAVARLAVAQHRHPGARTAPPTWATVSESVRVPKSGTPGKDEADRPPEK